MTVAVCASIAYAQDGKPTFEVVIRTVSEDNVSGRLVEFSLGSGLVLRRATDEQRHIPTIDIVQIARRGAEISHRTPDVSVRLARGDILHGRLSSGGEDHLTLETADLGRLSLSLDLVAGVEFAHARASAGHHAVSWFDDHRSGQEDQVLLTNGDVIRGFISAIDEEGISIESTLGETRISAALALAAQLVSSLPQPLDRPNLLATFVHTGRITASSFRWIGDVVDIETAYGDRATVEAERIVRIEVAGGRWEWLTQHQPISFQHTPMLSLDWEYAADRNVLGGPIKVAGRTFEHGIGVHSRSILTFDLKGIYTQFVTSFGMDDHSGPIADVSVAILVDGKLQYNQQHIVRGNLFGPVRLDVAKAKRIDLITDFGKNGDIQDRFNWVEPALIR